LEDRLKRKFLDYLFLGGLAGLIVVADQVSKALIRINLPVGATWPSLDINSPLRLFRTGNTGVAFGMFQGANLIFSILALLVSIAIIYYYPRVPKTDWTLRIALGLQLGGALGNLIDRVVFGFVTDFIALENFAIFNVADMSITVGVIVLLLGVWLQEQHKDKPHTEEQPANPLGSDEANSGEVKE
jgi:signal peptidase II